MTNAPGEIDSNRPWIRDYRDNPGAMNWAGTLLNPFGETSKLHFSRAWTMMFIGRLLLYLLPSVGAGILGIAGVQTGFLNTQADLVLFTVPALLLPFAVFVLITELTSFVAHARRLADAQRPAWLGVIVLVPMILGLAAYMAGTSMGAALHRAANAPAAEAAAGDAAGKAEAGKRPEGRSRGRGGPPGPPQSERQAAVSAGLGLALPVWWLTSTGVMVWTLLWVARLPNGGQGRMRTGSHLTPEEIAGGA